MKIKSGVFTTVKLEKTVESEESVKDTISKLRQQNGICRETDSNRQPIEFFCTKKGFIGVDEPASSRGEGIDRMFSVRGEVVEENGKTIVNIYSVYSKSEVFFRYFIMIFYSILAVGYFAVKLIFKMPIGIKDIMVVLWLGFLVFWFALSIPKEKGVKTQDLDIMINEIVKRVNAIKRWDE